MFTPFSYNTLDIIRDGLVFWGDVNDKTSYPESGTIWRDISTSNYTGTLTNGPTYNSSNGGTFLFDGIDDAIVLGTPANINSTYCTIAMWINSSNLSGTEVFFQRRNTRANTVRLRHFITGGIPNYTFTITNNSDTLIELQASSYTPVANRWEFLVGTYNGSFLYLYINGALEAFTPLSGTIDTTNYNAVTIGNNNGYSAGIQGNIATTYYYNRALTANEVLQNYEATKNRFV